MTSSRALAISIILFGGIFGAPMARAAEIVCDSPSMLDTLGPIRPNQHCRRVARTPASDREVPGPWVERTGGACRAYSGLYGGRRVYWRICRE